MPVSPTWLSTSTVAKRIGRSPTAVRDMADAGLFPGAYQVRTGSHWRIPAEAVDAFLQRRQAGLKRRSRPPDATAPEAR